MSTEGIVLIVAGVILLAICFYLWQRHVLKMPRGLPDAPYIPPPPGASQIEGLKHQVSISCDKIDALRESVWKLENPSKFSVLDKVRFEGASKKTKYRGVFIVMDVEVRGEGTSCHRFHRRYTAVNKKTGLQRTCIPESLLVKA